MDRILQIIRVVRPEPKLDMATTSIDAILARGGVRQSAATYRMASFSWWGEGLEVGSFATEVVAQGGLEV